MLDVQLFDLHTFLPKPYEEALLPRLKKAHEKLQTGTGLGGEFTGWVHLPQAYDREEFARIQAAAKKIQSDSQALVVIGIGGSYLGARGVIDCLCSPNYNLKKKENSQRVLCGQRSLRRRTERGTGSGAGCGFLREYHLQIRYHHGACRGLPFLPGAAGGEIRQGGSRQAHLRHHR